MKRFNFKSVIGASIVATLVMTIFMWIFGMNIMKMLGMIAGYNGTMMYVIGGAIHFGVGIFWGLVYALFFEPGMETRAGFLSGAFFSLVPLIAAMLFMGTFVTTIQGVFNANNTNMTQMGMWPCQPACGPCSPCSPCYPCQPDAPCNPYGYSNTANSTPCAPAMCGPCAPQGTKAGLPMWLWSLFNHLVFGIVLGWTYTPRIVTE